MDQSLLREFQDRWHLSRPELSELLHISINTLNHWMSSRRAGTARLQMESLDLIQLVDSQFQRWRTEDQTIPEIRTLYTLTKTRPLQSLEEPVGEIEKLTISWRIRVEEIQDLLGVTRSEFSKWEENGFPGWVENHLRQIRLQFECWKVEEERLPVHLRPFYELIRDRTAKPSGRRKADKKIIEAPKVSRIKTSSKQKKA